VNAETMRILCNRQNVRKCRYISTIFYIFLFFCLIQKAFFLGVSIPEHTFFVKVKFPSFILSNSDWHYKTCFRTDTYQRGRGAPPPIIDKKSTLLNLINLIYRY
jgi:hypothetical protein